MAILAGRHHLGTDRGRIVLTTARDGLAAQAGHDLTIEAARWSGELVVGDDLAPASLDVQVDLGALVVKTGTGGVKPLSDRDKREIAVTARKVLAADRHPEATFSASNFEAAAGGGGIITGTLTLAGRSRPLRLAISQPQPGEYRATASVTQTDFGIKPYSGFLGALKVRDSIGVQVEISLPDSDQPGTAGTGSAPAEAASPEGANPEGGAAGDPG
jgi:polyisoprenoid-binding protein YceI